MKICVTGASGQLGKELCEQSKYETYGTYLTHAPDKKKSNFFKLDIRDKKEVISNIKKIKPNWIVHLASETNVDLCEEDKDLAWQSNVVGVKNIADACIQNRCKLLLVSSDGVFDGNKKFYNETDIANPINFYGKTRLIGEWIAATVPHYAIARTSSLYSQSGKFASWVLKAAKQGKIEAIDDLYLCPTLTSELASCLLYMIKKDINGVYHTVGDERVSKYEFVRKLVNVFGDNQSIVTRVAMKDVAFKAKRPVDLSLDISKIKKIGFSFSNLDNAMANLKKQLSNACGE